MQHTLKLRTNGIDETGKRHGFLRVVRLSPVRSKAGNRMWQCRCDCGQLTIVRGTHLRRGQVQSCGHLQRHRTHGMSKMPEYRIWASAKQRCTNPKSADWHWYGGRGLKFAFPTFASFISEVGLRPSSRHQIDRINNGLGYIPGNLRWIYPGTNNSNRRAARLKKTDKSLAGMPLSKERERHLKRINKLVEQELKAGAMRPGPRSSTSRRR